MDEASLGPEQFFASHKHEDFNILDLYDKYFALNSKNTAEPDPAKFPPFVDLVLASAPEHDYEYELSLIGSKQKGFPYFIPFIHLRFKVGKHRFRVLSYLKYLYTKNKSFEKYHHIVKTSRYDEFQKKFVEQTWIRENLELGLVNTTYFKIHPVMEALREIKKDCEWTEYNNNTFWTNSISGNPK